VSQRRTSDVTHYSSDHLKQIPDQLESLIGDKRFLQAAILLVRSLKMINKPEMLEIGAVADLRAYLASQENVSLRDLPGFS
jgi:exocyst complex component 4